MREKPQYFYRTFPVFNRNTGLDDIVTKPVLCEYGDYRDKWKHPEHKRCTKRATKVSRIQVLFATRVGPLGDERIMRNQENFYCDQHSAAEQVSPSLGNS